MDARCGWKRSAQARELGGVDLSLDGFGTLGVVHSDYEQADFITANPLHLNGVGHTRSWGTDQDSKLGLQLTANLGDRITAMVQGVSQLRYDNTFRPELEWANIQFAVTADVNIRVGRVVLPTFLLTGVLRKVLGGAWQKQLALVPGMGLIFLSLVILVGYAVFILYRHPPVIG